MWLPNEYQNLKELKAALDYYYIVVQKRLAAEETNTIYTDPYFSNGSYGSKINGICDNIAIAVFESFYSLYKRYVESFDRLPIVELSDVDFVKWGFIFNSCDDIIEALCEDLYEYTFPILNNIWSEVESKLNEIAEGEYFSKDDRINTLEYYIPEYIVDPEGNQLSDLHGEPIGPSTARFIKHWFISLKQVFYDLQLRIKDPGNELIQKFIKERIQSCEEDSKEFPDVLDRIKVMSKSKQIETIEEEIYSVLHPESNPDLKGDFLIDAFAFSYDKITDDIDYTALYYYLSQNSNKIYSGGDLSGDLTIFGHISLLNELRELLKSVKNDNCIPEEIITSTATEITEHECLKSFFVDKNKADDYYSRLKSKVDDLLNQTYKRRVKDAMLYFYACEKGNLFGGKKIPGTVIEHDLGIQRTSVSKT